MRWHRRRYGGLQLFLRGAEAGIRQTARLTMRGAGPPAKASSAASPGDARTTLLPPISNRSPAS